MNTYIARVVGKLDYGLQVGVFKVMGEKVEQVGEYTRDYTHLFDTFFHFVKDGKDYALYSPEYTATRLMELPSCKDLGGEEPHGHGFCPTQFYVPSYFEVESYNELTQKTEKYRYTEPSPDSLVSRSYTYRAEDPDGGYKEYQVHHKSLGQRHFYPFGFVAGCVWGDDSSWKIQYLDLSQTAEGIIKREEKFGYIVLPNKLNIKEAIDLVDFRHDDLDDTKIRIRITKEFDIETGQLRD